MKKVLSFVLVLAMILGSVSMVFATDFTDQASITNTEASKVLSAIGVIEGYTDGSFKPAGILTRAEGAAIAARMLLGKTEAAKLTTVVGPFNDVPASHWAAGYISYCVSQGLLNGYGNGNFGPEDTLTVAAFGKMMLTALGYKSQNEGFVGDAWETNVGAAMVAAKLTDGVTLSGSNACSREVAAQVSLNTLKADLVWYDGTPITVNAGNVSVTTGQSAAKTIGAGDNGYDNTNANNCKHNNDFKMQFMEKYVKDLDLNVSAEAFGRPGVYEWKFENKKAATTKSDVKKIASYTTKQTHKTLYAMLDENSLVKDNIQIVYKLDGADVVASVANQNVKTWVNGWKNDADTSLGDKGTQIEVYYDATAANTIAPAGTYKGIVTVVAYNYYLVKATADYNSSKKSVKVTEISNFVLDTDSKELKSDDYAVENVKNEDYLIVTAVLSAGKYTVKSVVPATKVTGTVSAYTKGSNITVDGTKYNASTQFDKDVTIANAFDGFAVNTDITLVMDPNNFVLATTDEQSSNQYVYIRNAVPDSGLATKYIADAYFTDGTKQEITLKNATEYAKFDSDGPNTVGYGTGAGPAWYNYSVDKDGKYKLTAITNEAAGVGVVVNAGKVAYVAGKASATASTQFIVRKDNGDVLTYTGYKNVPGTTSGHTADTRAVLTNDGYAKVVFIQLDNNSVKGSSTSDYLVIYKTGAFDVNKDANGDYYAYGKTIVNGTKKDVTFSDTTDFQATTTTLQAELYHDVAYDSDGKITDGEALTTIADAHFAKVAGVSTASGAAITVAYKNGVLTVNTVGYELADSVAVFVIEGSSVDETSISSFKNSLDEAKTYTVYLAFTDDTHNIVKAVYAIETGNF